MSSVSTLDTASTLDKVNTLVHCCLPDGHVFVMYSLLLLSRPRPVHTSISIDKTMTLAEYGIYAQRAIGGFYALYFDRVTESCHWA